MNGPIVLTYDGSAFSEAAAPVAVELAKRTRQPLHVIRVHEFSVPANEPELKPPYEPDFLTVHFENENKEVEQLRDSLAKQGVQVVGKLLHTGLTIPLLRDYIKDVNAGYVVMTTHGRSGWNRLWLGSVTTGLLRTSSAPVLVVRPDNAETQPTAPALFKKMVITLDGSEMSEGILPAATKLAELFDMPFTLLTVQNPAALGDADEYLGTVAARLHAGQRVQSVVLSHHHAASAILEYVAEHNIDVVAMSTHGRGSWGRAFMGSVADKVVRATSAAAVLIQNPEQVAWKRDIHGNGIEVLQDTPLPTGPTS